MILSTILFIPSKHKTKKDPNPGIIYATPFSIAIGNVAAIYNTLTDCHAYTSLK